MFFYLLKTELFCIEEFEKQSLSLKKTALNLWREFLFRKTTRGSEMLPTTEKWQIKHVVCIHSLQRQNHFDVWQMFKTTNFYYYFIFGSYKLYFIQCFNEICFTRTGKSFRTERKIPRRGVKAFCITFYLQNGKSNIRLMNATSKILKLRLILDNLWIRSVTRFGTTTTEQPHFL